MLIENCPSLRLCDMSSICGTFPKNAVIFSGNIGIETLYIPNISTIECWNGGAFCASNVTKIILPNVVYVKANNNNCIGTSCDNLHSIIFGNLLEYGNPLFAKSGWYGCDIIHFEVCYIGGSLKISLNMSRISSSTKVLSTTSNDLVEDNFCNNNMEQFLYNFRTYIIERLYDYSGGTKHNVTLNTSWYKSILGQDSTGYANTFHMPNEDIDYVTSLNNKLLEINWGLAYA